MLEVANTPPELEEASFLDQEFSIFAQRKTWPLARDKVFIAEAVDTLCGSIWGTEDRDLNPLRRKIDTDGDPLHRSGMLWTMVKLFTTLLADGSLSTFGRPVGGNGTMPLINAVWDGDTALHAVATGTLVARGEDGIARQHWVFLDRIEFDLLLLIHSPAGGRPDDVLDNLQRRHDRLAEIVLGNLAAIARARSAALPTRAGAGAERTGHAHDPSSGELDEMFKHAARVLNADQQLLLIGRVAGWLAARFEEDPGKVLTKPILKKRVKLAFAPYLSDKLFLQAWQVATADFPERAKAGRPDNARRSD